jgi:hypothetical protein
MATAHPQRRTAGTLLLALAPTVSLMATAASAQESVSVPTATAQDTPSVSFDPQSCRYEPLSGSHIKVKVCTAKDGAEYRMDRRARTNAVVFVYQPVGPPALAVPAPLPQVQ